MALTYKCKHCSKEMGSLQIEEIDLEKIGWEYLSEQEKLQLLQYTPDQTITITSICESCEHIIENNPLYHELDYFIQ